MNIINLKKCLFTYLTASDISCSIWIPEYGLQQLWCMGYLVVAHELCCSMIYGILVPGPGIEPMSPDCKMNS